ncbi:p32K [Bovine atadenovirus D]|uniref:P32K n=1 Tax=Bovine adenovirus 4 TaxID=70333 RepID=Q997I9_ADEB4|nr:p32K [Bovine atadenovirus D]AAK13176.1 p32K [Bovine adenovirus 4]
MLTDFYNDLMGGAYRRTYRRTRKAKKRKDSRRSHVNLKKRTRIARNSNLYSHLRLAPTAVNEYHSKPRRMSAVLHMPISSVQLHQIEEPKHSIASRQFFNYRRPPDGEEDVDYQAKNKWSLEDVISYLQHIPKQVRKVILTSLFGATLGLIIDALLGGPWGLTTRLLRLIVSLVPGGKILLLALDGLGYFLGKNNNPNLVAYDPDLIKFGTNIQRNINGRLTEDIVRAAEEQLGGGFMRTLAALLSAAASAGTHLKIALPAIPLAVIKPFQR